MQRIVDERGFEEFFAVLHAHGELVGPTERDGAIVVDHPDTVAQLPVGVYEVQSPGRYRLRRTPDAAPTGGRRSFGYTTTATPWKRWLFEPRTLLVRARRDPALPNDGRDSDGNGRGFRLELPTGPSRRPLVLFGMRPCDVAAVLVQDRVLLGGPFADRHYRARREGAVVVVAQCTDPAATCCCASAGTGPTATTGFDLSITELPAVPPSPGVEPADGRPHRFLLDAVTETGRRLLGAVTAEEPTADDVAEATALGTAAASAMVRSFDAGDARDLGAMLTHPHWDEVGSRCLSCGNCTAVCPTCFCSTVEDTTSIDGAAAERWRQWDSCFTLDHSSMNGRPVRSTTVQRYRQWLTHKVSTWHDQFGESGCVGCGRCITWCPVGIDLTEELAALSPEAMTP